MPSEQEWIEEYKKRGALWIHDENPKRPHARLTSGNHSDGFFNSELVMEDPRLVERACVDLFDLLIERSDDLIGGIHRVVGPAMGAITLAHEISRLIAMCRPKGCLRAYTEKEEIDGVKKMVFKKTAIRPKEKILLVEDVLTTGGSVGLVSDAIVEAGGTVLPFVLVLVNRSGLTEVSGKEIVALIDRPMPMWDPGDCPLCELGSEAIRPKGNENWARLNATY